MIHGISVPLITSAVGYWVLTTSEKEKGRVKKLGQWLGLLTIVIGLAGTALQITSIAKACRARGYGMNCPFTGGRMGGPGMPPPPSK